MLQGALRGTHVSGLRRASVAHCLTSMPGHESAAHCSLAFRRLRANLSTILRERHEVPVNINRSEVVEALDCEGAAGG